MAKLSAVEEKTADLLSNALATTIEKTLYGGKVGTKETEGRAEFYALVLSKTGDKFFATQGGKKLLTKISWTVVLPSILLGLGAGYYLFRKRG
jgi:uncharacterized membrane protein